MTGHTSLYLQNKKYPAPIHTRNTITLRNDVVGIIRISSIPAAAQSRANPRTRFMSAFIPPSFYLVYSIQISGRVLQLFSASVVRQDYSSTLTESRMSATSSSVTLSSFRVVNLSRTSGTRSMSFVIVS